MFTSASEIHYKLDKGRNKNLILLLKCDFIKFTTNSPNLAFLAVKRYNKTVPKLWSVGHSWLMKAQLKTFLFFTMVSRLCCGEPGNSAGKSLGNGSLSIYKDKQKPPQMAMVLLGLDFADSHHQARHTQRSKE